MSIGALIDHILADADFRWLVVISMGFVFKRSFGWIVVLALIAVHAP